MNIDFNNQEYLNRPWEKGVYEIYRVDNDLNGELTEITDNISFDLELFSIVLIKEK